MDQGLTYNAPVKKVSDNCIFWTRDMWRPHTIRRGRQSITISISMFGTATAM